MDVPQNVDEQVLRERLDSIARALYVDVRLEQLQR